MIRQPQMDKVSAIVITYNEEKNIEDCLSSLSFADEIIAVDSNSSDNTIALAKKFTDKIISMENLPYGVKRNIGIDNSSFEWIFWVDADERVTKHLEEEIKSITQNKNAFNAYYINRKSFFVNKFINHCGWYPDSSIRLFKKSSGIRFDTSQVHEKISYRGKTGKIKNDVLHYTDKDFEHYVEKLNHYTTLSAVELGRKNKKSRILDMIFRPVFTFLKMYFLRFGFLDGYTGLILCVLSSYHVFFKYAKYNTRN
jgi:glycosyltransferase involved in cell wall biosynthesis